MRPMWYGYVLVFVTSTPQNIKAGGNSTCTNTWICLDHISSVFLFIYEVYSLPFASRMMLYIRKGAFYSQVLVRTKEQTSSWTSLRVHFNRSSVVTVRNQVHKKHIGVLVIGKRRGCHFKWHVWSYLIQYTYYKENKCTVSSLTYCWISHGYIHE
jgi:hypothetical protein